jgi:acyl-CoA dehydrogenase
MSNPVVAPLNELSLAAQSGRIGVEVAAKHADRVDRDAVYPREAMQALASARLLGVQVPRDLGGSSATLAEVSAMCTALGRHCANTAMIFAMHQIQVACIVRHGLGEPALRTYAREGLVLRQELLASATTETGVGGDVRTSLCTIERNGERFRLEKNAPVISYGREADGILATARRAADAPSGDQVITLLRRSEYQLQPKGLWETMGFRGTCSEGFLLQGEAPSDQILPQPYAEISAQTMLPVSHILWSSVWLGMAQDAAERARTFVRAEARRRPGVMPPGALRLAELGTLVQGFQSNVAEALRYYEAIQDDRDALGGMGIALRMNNLKVSASQLVVTVVAQALQVCGIAGYRCDTPFTLARHLRDAYGASLMINNDRILGGNAQMLLVYKETYA